MSPTLDKFTSAKGPSNRTSAAQCKNASHNHHNNHHQHHLKSLPQAADQVGPAQKQLEPGRSNQNDQFSAMLNKIETAFNRSNSSVDVDELWKVLEDYKSKQEEWAKYAYYDMRKYKRNLVAEYDKYNVMIICWGPGSQSCIHDHSGSHCFMKMLDGELVESRFAWPDQNQITGAQSQEMCRLSDTLMKHNDVLYINDKVGLHLVGNPHMNKTAASLHVYIPPYRKCKAFDQRTGQAVQCELNFYSKCGRVVADEEEEAAGWLK